MRDPRRSLAALAVAAGVALLGGLAPAAPAYAQDDGEEVAGDPVDLGAYGQPLRFVATSDETTFTLDDGTRYGGTIEARLSPSGTMVVVSDVTMQTYVEGLGEVPFSWPMEALKAQVVAARTYAWHSIQLATFVERGLGYDICDTVACQVYRGRDWVLGPGGDRWRQAVAETRGEVLTYEGEPILARYFSTSGGRTRDNEEVFPSEGPRPYLKGVDDPDDAVSPLHRWTVTFTREQFDEILSHGETLQDAVPMRDVRWVDPDTGADRVIVTRDDGHEVEVSASAFRGFVSDVAPQLYPDDYPAPRPDSDSRYPATLMSSRLGFTVTEDEVVVDGRGWGHGVGMSQYGARGQADRGVPYAEILRSYYTDVDGPHVVDALPDRVRVGIDERTEPLSLRADGPFRVEVAGRTITERGLGQWRVSLRGDRTLGLVAPPGYGAPLVVDPTVIDDDAPTTLGLVELETVVNKPSELRLEVTDTDGTDVLVRDLGIVDPGRHTVDWDLDDADGAQLPPGGYRVRLAAVDEDATVGGEPTDVDIRAITIAPADTSLLAPRDGTVRPVGPDPAVLALAGVAGLVVGGLVGVIVPVGARGRRRG